MPGARHCKFESRFHRSSYSVGRVRFRCWAFLGEDLKHIHYSLPEGCSLIMTRGMGGAARA